ncbi:MAG TPA: glycosyltransferase, partial [Acidimicrobiales bacterium]|nr:glycosyltransferase [Acidimicrobiales bacterium]
QLRSRAATLDYLEHHVEVSVVVAPAPGDLDQTLASIRAQCYDRIEVLVAARAEGTTRYEPGATRAASLNAAMATARGDYVLCVLQGDVLAPNCVFDLVHAVQSGEDAAYGDEDRIERGEHTAGHLKPARFGRETLYSYDVVGAPLLVRRQLACELGYDDAAHPVESHDLALRLAERTAAITHVPGVLLSRPASLDPDPADATAATISVVTRALARQGRSASVSAGEVLPSVRYVVAPPTPAPSIAIVIPTRDRLDLLRACVDSVRERTTYASYSIVILDNDSKEEETLRWMKESGLAIVPCPGPFNYASIVNRGVQGVEADYVVTLNNDTTIATPDWLERMVGLCSLDSVGSVGVKLRYPDGRLQHEGVGIIPMPVHLSRDVNYPEVDRWLTSTRDAAAVTGACQMVRMQAWRELGGLDPAFDVGYNDIDFGIRLTQAGWRVVYTPEVVVGHRESASRGNVHPRHNVLELIARWDLLGGFVDPSVAPSTRAGGGGIELAAPPRDVAAAPGASRLGAVARRGADVARALLDDRADPALRLA